MEELRGFIGESRKRVIRGFLGLSPGWVLGGRRRLGFIVVHVSQSAFDFRQSGAQFGDSFRVRVVEPHRVLQNLDLPL